MATYAIGDIQGCYDDLQNLLVSINFNANNDQLWFCGDLVNRGPKSLETLRFIKGLGPSARCVLGNHDLHLLAVSSGCSRYHHPKDTLDEIIDADDHQDIIHWLRQQPLIFNATVNQNNFTVVHAGIPPQWNIKQALTYGEEVHQQLKSDNYIHYLKNMYGNEPNGWQDKLQGDDRLRVITNYFTRMRFCNTQGEIDLTHKGVASNPPEGFQPWFLIEERQAKTDHILFGHWAALEGNNFGESHVHPTDTGCVWGKKLSALRLDDLQWFSTPAIN